MPRHWWYMQELCRNQNFRQVIQHLVSSRTGITAQIFLKLKLRCSIRCQFHHLGGNAPSWFLFRNITEFHQKYNTSKEWIQTWYISTPKFQSLRTMGSFLVFIVFIFFPKSFFLFFLSKNSIPIPLSYWRAGFFMCVMTVKYSIFLQLNIKTNK